MAVTHEDTRRLILQLLDSGEWWVLIDVGRSELPRVIQERHYADDPGDGFRLVLGPELAYQPLAFFLMRKSAMTAAELSKCVSDAGGEALPAALFEQRSFLFSPRRDAPAVLVDAFYRWLDAGRKYR